MAQTLEKLFLTKIATMPKEEIDEGTPGKDFFRFSYSIPIYFLTHTT